MQNLFIKIRCISWKKLFFSCCLVCISMTRAFRCQYALENKVCVPTSGGWRWYTMPSVYWRLARALTYHADGIPTSGGVGKFAQIRYADFWRPKSEGEDINFCVPVRITIENRHSAILGVYGEVSEMVTSESFSKFMKVLDVLSLYRCPIILCGDFNMHVTSTMDLMAMVRRSYTYCIYLCVHCFLCN